MYFSNTLRYSFTIGIRIIPNLCCSVAFKGILPFLSLSEIEYSCQQDKKKNEAAKRSKGKTLEA